MAQRRHTRCFIFVVSVCVFLLMRGWGNVFTPNAGTNKRMEEHAEKMGWRLRTPVAELGWDDHGLSKENARDLSILSQAAKKLDWSLAGSVWKKCNQQKTPLCNAAMHAAFRCGKFVHGKEIYQHLCKSGLPKNAITFNCAIRIFTQLDERDAVLEVWEEARLLNQSWQPRQFYLLMNEMVT